VDFFEFIAAGFTGREFFGDELNVLDLDLKFVNVIEDVFVGLAHGYLAGNRYWMKKAKQKYLRRRINSDVQIGAVI
jgi:hypothetical protein